MIPDHWMGASVQAKSGNVILLHCRARMRYSALHDGAILIAVMQSPGVTWANKLGKTQVCNMDRLEAAVAVAVAVGESHNTWLPQSACDSSNKKVNNRERVFCRQYITC